MDAGCALIRRGLKAHFPALGSIGVAIYVWLLLDMDPTTRSLDTSIDDIRRGVATGRGQVYQALQYLEAHGYISYVPIPGRGCHIEVLKPECNVIGGECPMARAEAPCQFVADTVRVTGAVVRQDEQAGVRAKAANKQAALRVFTFWNEQAITRHKQLPPRMENAIMRMVKEFGEEKVMLAIDNYGTIMADPDTYWFTHKYTLDEFVGRYEGRNIIRFSELGALKNFSNNGNGKSRANATAGKYDDL